MLTESEISALLEQKLQAKKQEMINAWMAFQRNPTAKTFKASEDIPDKLMGEVLDEVAKEVLASSAPTIKEDEPSKKKLRLAGKRKISIQLKHGLTVQVEAYYYIRVRQESRGRKRKVGRRGKAGGGYYPLLSRIGVVANASPALCEDVVIEVLRESYEEAHEALIRAGIEISIKRMRTITNALGRRSVELRDANKDGNKIEESCAGQIIAVAVDGGRTLIRTNSKGRPLASGYHGFSADWREPKLFTIYEVDEKGRKRKKGVVRCDGTFGGSDALVQHNRMTFSSR